MNSNPGRVKLRLFFVFVFCGETGAGCGRESGSCSIDIVKGEGREPIYVFQIAPSKVQLRRWLEETKHVQVLTKTVTGAGF